MERSLVIPARACGLDQLETHIQSELRGQVRDFRLVLCGEALVLKGHAHTYHAKQLAQHAVMKLTPLPIVANEIEVS